MKLDTQQQECWEFVRQGKNIWITGSAGCGKSFTVRYILHQLVRSGKKVACTAMTGCAATLLDRNATTLHSYLGIGYAKDSEENLCDRIRKRSFYWKRWKQMEVLLIDEVSMLGPRLFNTLESMARQLRNRKEERFGGVQLILVGDFFQLPPVEETQFLFESPRFKECIDHSMLLQTVYRQREDQEWFDMLQHIRWGVFTKRDQKLLRERLSPSMDLHEVPHLYSKNNKIRKINEDRLSGLPTASHKSYTAKKIQGPPTMDIQDICRRWGIEETLHLATGAMVMLTGNLDISQGYVNGSQGRIVGFSMGGNPVVEFRNTQQQKEIMPHEYRGEDPVSKTTLVLSQIPLQLAWAVSIHKVQGQSMESAYMDLGEDIFEYGQIYVALSRIPHRKGVFLKSLDLDRIQANPKVVQFYQEWFPRKVCCPNNGKENLHHNGS